MRCKDRIFCCFPRTSGFIMEAGRGCIMNWLAKIDIDLPIQNKVGHLRCDFADGRLSQNWFGQGLLNNNEIAEVSKKLIGINELIPNYDFIVDLCGGEGLDKSANRFTASDNFIYWINFIPVMDSYHYYVHVYKK